MTTASIMAAFADLQGDIVAFHCFWEKMFSTRPMTVYFEEHKKGSVDARLLWLGDDYRRLVNEFDIQIHGWDALIDCEPTIRLPASGRPSVASFREGRIIEISPNDGPTFHALIKSLKTGEAAQMASLPLCTIGLCYAIERWEKIATRENNPKLANLGRTAALSLVDLHEGIKDWLDICLPKRQLSEKSNML